MSSDLVAEWKLSLPDGRHLVEFEHGTTSGKRVIRVDGKEVFRVDWMFKLVGKESFDIGKHKCKISIDACSGFAYEYTLEVDGKPLQKFRENQSKIQKCWLIKIDELGTTKFRVVLEKNTLNIWVNGSIVESTGEFDDEGSITHFALGDTHSAYIKTISSGKKKTGMLQKLFVDDIEIPETTE